MAILIKADGEVLSVKPLEGKEFSLEELQTYVGGYIEVVMAAGVRGKFLILNEDGMRLGLPPNVEASKFYHYTILGDVVMVDEGEIG